MRSFKSFFLASACGLCLPLCAQQHPGSQAAAGTSGRQHLPMQIPPASSGTAATPTPGQMTLNVVVTDRSGKPVSGLEKADFTLLQDKHPVPIEAFQAWDHSASAPPAGVFLAIDTVNIPYWRVAYVRQAVDAFLRENKGHLAHPVTVLWVTDTGVEVNSETTDNGNLLAQQVRATSGKLRFLNRNAGSWGDIEQFQMSVQMLGQVVHALGRLPGRKLLIWLGPGWPMLDSPNIMLDGQQQQGLFNEIVGLTSWMRQSQITLYSVSQGISNVNADLYEGFLSPVRKPSQANPPNLALKVLAVESGGIAMEPSNDLQVGIDTCAAQASTYYTIGFETTPAHRPDEYHSLLVHVNKRGLIARTVTGYYAQPPQAKR